MKLSPAEDVVLHWLCEGKTNKEIGVILGKSALTVKNQLSSIMNKFGVNNRTALAVAHVRAQMTPK